MKPIFIQEKPNKKKLNFGLKIILTVLSILILSSMNPENTKAEYVAVHLDSIYVVDDITFLPVSIAKLTMPPYSIAGANSVTWNSDDINYYIILELFGQVGIAPKFLARVDPFTGVCEYIGLLGDGYESLTYDSDAGNLYAISNSEASGSDRRQLAIVDINTAAVTPVGNYGADDFHVIAYSYTDGMIYHWSGSEDLGGDARLEKINPVTLVSTPVPTSGASYDRVTGAVYVGGGLFAAVDRSQAPGSVYRVTSFSLLGFNTVYSVIPIGLRGFGFTDPVLPVELSSFTSLVENNNVTLNWSTSGEVNNSVFDIERAVDNGQLTIDSWTKIGNVSGNGTSEISHNYSFTDRNLASGNYSYRLKQIDFNGNFEYFNLSNEVNIGVPNEYTLSQNYPNPFNPTTNLEIGISELGFVSLKVYDIKGKEVMTLVNEQKAPGYYTVSFNGANLSSGIYFYTINAGDFVSTKKMTLIK